MRGRQIAFKIARQHIPHHNAVIGQQGLGLAQLDASVGRAKQVGFDGQHSLAFPHVLVVDKVVGFPAVEVIKSMITNRMSLFENLRQHLGVFLNVLADAKKSGFGLILSQLLQNPFGDVGNGAVVEGEINYFFVGGHIPNELGIESPQQAR